MNMKIAITGGSGFVGRAITARLLEDGHQVTVVARHVSSEDNDGSVTFAAGNVITGEGLKEIFTGHDAVIHLVGIIKEAGSNTFDRVHRQGTEHVIAAAEAAGVPRYLHMSALGTRQGATSLYHRTKLAGEFAVRASRLKWTIFRPSIIFGPGDSFINMLAGVLKKTLLMPVVGGGRNRMQPVYVNDVAGSFASALGLEKTNGRTYELGGADILTFREILSAVARVLELKRLFVPVPTGLVAIFAAAAEKLRIPLPVTTDQLEMLKEDNVVRGGDDPAELGVEFVGLEVTLGKYLK
jgi:NADH dehydrogenase